MTEVPKAFTIGDINKFSRNSMWWAFNFVSNFANLRYSYMIKDIQKTQTELEDKFIREQDSVISISKGLNEAKRQKVLTNYTLACGNLTHNKWLELGEFLITKYNDGYIKDENGQVQQEGYPEDWKKQVIDNNPEKYLIPDWNKENNIKDLPY